MNVRNYLDKKISDEKTAHLTLIDPDEQSPEKAAEIAKKAETAGSDGIMVGGSTRAEGHILDDTINQVKEGIDLPTILFPSSQGGISKEADAIFFMSLLNSKDPFFITGAQMKGAPLIKKYGIEPLSLGYLIIEPGGTVGKVGKADLVPRNDSDRAMAYGLASQYLGMDYLYLEAGSGAEDPVPQKMVKKVRKAVDSCLIVGGGIRSPESAKKIADSGAAIIVTGTIAEEAENKFEKINQIVGAIKDR